MEVQSPGFVHVSMVHILNTPKHIPCPSECLLIVIIVVRLDVYNKCFSSSTSFQHMLSLCNYLNNMFSY